MLRLRLTNVSSEELMEINNSLVGWQPFIDSEVVVTEGQPNGPWEPAIIMGEDNGADLELDVQVMHY